MSVDYSSVSNGKEVFSEIAGAGSDKELGVHSVKLEVIESLLQRNEIEII